MRYRFKALLVAAIVLMAVIPGAYGVTVSVSAGSGGTVDTIGNRFNTNIGTSLFDQITAIFDSEGKLMEGPISIEGSFSNFEHNHQVTDSEYNHAEVHAKVVNGKDLVYSDLVVPAAEIIGISELGYATAQQWLTVGPSGSIICSQSASDAYGNAAASSIRISSNYQDSQGDTVFGSLDSYHGWAGAGKGLATAYPDLFTSDLQSAEAGQYFSNAAGMSIIANEMSSDNWASGGALLGDNAGASTTIVSGEVNDYFGSAAAGVGVLEVIGDPYDPNKPYSKASQSFGNAFGNSVQAEVHSSDAWYNNAGASTTIANGELYYYDGYAAAGPEHVTNPLLGSPLELISYYDDQAVLAAQYIDYAYGTKVVAEEHSSDAVGNNAGASLTTNSPSANSWLGGYLGLAGAGINAIYPYLDTSSYFGRSAIAGHIVYDAGTNDGSAVVEEHSSDASVNNARASLTLNKGDFYWYEGRAGAGTGMPMFSVDSYEEFIINPFQMATASQWFEEACGTAITANEASSDVAGDKNSVSTMVTGLPATRKIPGTIGELEGYSGSSVAGMCPTGGPMIVQAALTSESFWHAGGEYGDYAYDPATIVTNEQVSNKMGTISTGVKVGSGNLYGYRIEGEYGPVTTAANGYGLETGHKFDQALGKTIESTSSASNAIDGSKYSTSTKLAGTDGEVSGQYSNGYIGFQGFSDRPVGVFEHFYELSGTSINSEASASIAGNLVIAKTNVQNGLIENLVNSAVIGILPDSGHKGLFAGQYGDDDPALVTGDKLTLDTTAATKKKTIHPTATVFTDPTREFWNRATVDLATKTPDVDRGTTPVPI